MCTQCLTGAVAAARNSLFVGQLDLIRELIVDLRGRLLQESVASDRLERLLYVDRILCARLKVGSAVLGLAPLLRSLRRHLYKQEPERGRVSCSYKKIQNSTRCTEYMEYYSQLVAY